MERQRDPHLTLLQYCPTDGVHLSRGASVGHISQSSLSQKCRFHLGLSLEIGEGKLNRGVVKRVSRLSALPGRKATPSGRVSVHSLTVFNQPESSGRLRNQLADCWGVLRKVGDLEWCRIMKGRPYKNAVISSRPNHTNPHLRLLSFASLLHLNFGILGPGNSHRANGQLVQDQ